MIKLYSINQEYLDFLRKCDQRIPRDDYPGRYKPFVGILFKNDGCSYLVALSSFKEKYSKFETKKDFIKLNIKDETVAVLNLNYMFPVPETEYNEVLWKDIETYRTFSNETEKSQYIKFLRLELREIQKTEIQNKAYQLYQIKNEYPQANISKRCLEFRELECKCTEWILRNEYSVDTSIKNTKNNFIFNYEGESFNLYSLDIEDILEEIKMVNQMHIHMKL